MALSYDLNPIKEKLLIQPPTTMTTDITKTQEGACLMDTGEVTMGIGAGPFPPLPPIKPIPPAAPRTPAEPAVWELEERPPRPVLKEQRRFVPAEMQLVLPKPITPPQEEEEEEDEDEEEWEVGQFTQDPLKGGLEQAEVMAEDYPFIPLGLELAEYRGEGEYPGEFSDADWKNADKYGYSIKFPYKKNKKPKDGLHPEDGFLSLEKDQKPFAYVYKGDSVMSTSVETDVLQPRGPDYVYAATSDKATQTCSADIAEEYRLLALEEAEEAAKKALAAERKAELDALKLKSVPSLQADAKTLVRPVGYKPLELTVGLGFIPNEAFTQVNEQMLDEEWAMERGVILATNDILWPTVEEFELENAARRLYDYIKQCWTVDSKWMYYIHPVQSFTDNLKKRVTFEAKFSVPTPQNPVPVATASVFFIFEMSHYAPRDEVVKVHYVVEGTRFRHSPGSVPFQDKWLWSVISDKIRVQRSLGF